MRLLLDTHVVIWWSQHARRLTAATRRLITETDEVFVSAASEWEVSIKVALGKLRVPGPLMEVVSSSGFLPLPITFAHAESVRKLPRLHTDPFDRMLVAQAGVEGLHLVSRDHLLAEYEIDFLPA
jgi:PIN domain nuclease of toxin-antitoxin system